MRSYWDKVLSGRTSRRRALIGSSALAASAAFLAACGGDDDNDSTGATGGSPTGGGTGATGSTGGGGSSGMIHTPVNETANAKHGGQHISVQANGLVTHDPHLIGAHATFGQRVFSQLFRVKAGVEEQTSGEIMGDLAESWELSPDRTTLTVKLDKSAAFGPQAPINGRIVDVEDVLASWERVKRIGSLASDLSNEVNSQAPITNIEAPDAETLVISLNEPNASIYTLLGHNGLGGLWVIPKEASDESVLNIARDPRGTGPYYLTESNEVNLRFKKNPGFKRASLSNNEPYIEEIFEPVITDTATISAQFRAGQIYEAQTFPSLEMVDAKKNNPDLLMYLADPINTERVYFGHAAGSPFIDERLRIAYYRCIDRDTYITAAYNTDRFAADGLEVTEYWEGSFKASSWTGWLLDPKSVDDYGDAQQNFVVNIEEAKKLVEAAGFTTPFEYDQVQSAPGPTSFAQPIYDRKDVWEGMIRDAGVFAPKIKNLDWNTEWTAQIRRSGGQFVGASWGPDTSTADPTTASFFVYNSAGGYYEGGDDHLTDLTFKIRGEFDVDARRDLVRELQVYDATHMFNQKIGVAASFAIVWPVVRNVAVFRGGTNWLDIRTGSDLNAWIDPTQAPLKQSTRFWSTPGGHA